MTRPPADMSIRSSHDPADLNGGPKTKNHCWQGSSEPAPNWRKDPEKLQAQQVPLPSISALEEKGTLSDKDMFKQRVFLVPSPLAHIWIGAMDKARMLGTMLLDYQAIEALAMGCCNLLGPISKGDLQGSSI